MFAKRSSSLPLVMTLVVGTSIAIAGDFDDQRSFSYVGYLEDGSVPVSGDKAMQFSLFSSQGAVTACQTIAKDPVDVEAGTFGVVLEQIAEGCTLTGALYMEIGVAEAGATDYIAVGGRHQITGVPFAMGASGQDGVMVGKGDVVFIDDDNTNDTTAQVVLSGDDGQAGVVVKTLTNPPAGEPIFRVLSSGNAERLRVEHDGETFVDQNFSASGTVTAASLDVDGTATVDGLTTHNADVDLQTHALLFTDTLNASTQVELTANDSVYDEEGLNVRALTNPNSGEAIFRVLSEGGAERLRVEHDGETFVDQDLTASGTVTGGDISTTGTVTFGALSGFTTSGSYTASAYDNTNDTISTTMTSTSTSICFLTRTQLRDIEGGTEYAECVVNTSNGNWRLQAKRYSNSDAEAYCAARCLSWN